MVKRRLVEAISGDDSNTKLWRMRFASARMSYESGKLQEAERMLHRLMEPAEQLKEHKFAHNMVMVGLAAVYISQGRYKEARSNLEKSMRALEGAASPLEQELYAVALRFHADALIEKKDFRAAEQELKKAISILEGLGIDAAVQLAYALSDLGGLYVIQGRGSEAAQFVPESMQILAATLGEENAEYIRADMIGQLCTTSDGEMLDSREIMGIKLQYQFGANHPQMLKVLRRYVEALKGKGDTARLEEAKKHFAAFDKAVKV